jgi:hypothetical protein
MDWILSDFIWIFFGYCHTDENTNSDNSWIHIRIFFIDTDVDTVFIWNRIDTGLDNYPDPDFFLK